MNGSMITGTNVLFLSTKIKSLSAYEYCKEHSYNVRVLHMADMHPNDSETLYLEKTLGNDFMPDWIINFKEQEKYLKREKELSAKYGLNTFLTEDNIKFFSSKVEQDRVFKSLDIPTVPNSSDKVLQKSDLSGGTNFKVVNREDATGFFQDYVDIDTIVSCHLYADDNSWYWLNNHVIYYENNCPKHSCTPYLIDLEVIESSIKKLSQNISIKNKIFGWQFLFDKNGDVYSIDFNLRPFGGFDKGSYDRSISDQNWIDYLFGKTPPESILYTHTVKCHYKEKIQFGYSDINRIKDELKHPILFKVKKYDNI